MSKYSWDSDGDRLPDGWEYQIQLDPNDALDTSVDFDGDCLSNYPKPDVNKI